MPYLTIVCVWPPQTSMIVHGRVTVRAMAAASLPGRRRRRGIRRGISWRRHLQLVELVHLLQEREDAPRLGLVDPRQGEADVDQDVVAELRRRARAPGRRACRRRRNRPCPSARRARGRSRRPCRGCRDTSLRLLLRGSESRRSARRGDGQLAEAQAAVVRRHQAVAVDAEAVAARAARPPRASAGRSGTRRRSGRPSPSPVAARSRPQTDGDRSRPGSSGTAGR